MIGVFGKRRNRKPRRWLRVASAIAGLLAIAYFSLPLFFAPARVAPAEVILHLAIDPRSRGDEYVRRLYEEGVARRIIAASSQISWKVYSADFARAHLIEMGVPAENVSILHLPMLECGAEYLPILADHLKQQGFRSVLVIVSPTLTRWGQRRSESYFRAAGIQATVTFVPEARAAMLDRWWRTHWKAQAIALALMNSTIDLLYARCR